VDERVLYEGETCRKGRKRSGRVSSFSRFPRVDVDGHRSTEEKRTPVVRNRVHTRQGEEKGEKVVSVVSSSPSTPQTSQKPPVQRGGEKRHTAGILQAKAIAPINLYSGIGTPPFASRFLS
jgi:hypothetical protein